MRILAPRGVFRPRSDTRLLAERMVDEPTLRDGSVLDLCTGSGALAVVAARHGAGRVAAVDISRRAVVAAKLNGALNRAHVRARRGDLLAPFAGERFDLVVSNPPYVPSDRDVLPQRGAARAWEGGVDGRALLDRICHEAPAALAPGGVLLLVHSSVCGESVTLEHLRARGLAAEVIVRRSGPLGPLLTSRAMRLEHRGLLAPGAREEDLVVVRAEKRARPAVDGRAAASGG